VGETVVVGSCNGVIHGLDRATGKARWKCDAGLDGGRPEFRGVVRLDTRLYAVTLDGELAALDLADGRQVWSAQGGPPLERDFLNVAATPAIYSDRIFFAGADGVVRALSTTSGAPVWKSEVGSPVWTALVVLSDALRRRRRRPVEDPDSRAMT